MSTATAAPEDEQGKDEQGAASSEIGGSHQLSTMSTLRRGFELSPELARGLWLTVLLAVFATLGKVLIPFVVQQATDHGIMAEGGPDVDFVVRMVLLAAGAIVFTSIAQYAVNIRLFRAAESGLATLRIKAFRHIHDLSVLTQSTERRGALVSRVTSDVDTISMFVQFGGLMLLVSIA